jgi:hypothetical protein
MDMRWMSAWAVSGPEAPGYDSWWHGRSGGGMWATESAGWHAGRPSWLLAWEPGREPVAMPPPQGKEGHAYMNISGLVVVEVSLTGNGAQHFQIYAC